MSNGPYWQGGCDCESVVLLAVGAPLGADGRLGCLWWCEDDVQVAFGLGALVMEADYQGPGDAWRCRSCARRIWVALDDVVETPQALWPEVLGDEGDEGDSASLRERFGHGRLAP